MKNRRPRPGAGHFRFRYRGKQHHEAPDALPRDGHQHKDQREFQHGAAAGLGPSSAGPQIGRTPYRGSKGASPGEARRRDFAPPETTSDDRLHGAESRRGEPGKEAMDRGRGRQQHRVSRDNVDMIFGVEPIRELVATAPGMVRTLYLRAGTEGRLRAEADAVRGGGGEVIIAADEDLRRMAGSDARHQGVVAIVREYQYAALEDVLAAQPDPLLLIDGVTDPRNLGALLRSAEGAGAQAIVLARDHTVGLTPTAIKASAGAWVHLAIARCGNVAQTLELLKQAGYWIAALAPAGGVGLYDLDVARRLVLIAGSEGRGVRELVKKRADFIVRIPMRGRVGSLNVAVATAVALFEIARRRGS